MIIFEKYIIGKWWNPFTWSRVWKVANWEFVEISVVQNPSDPYCYIRKNNCNLVGI